MPAYSVEFTFGIEEENSRTITISVAANSPKEAQELIEGFVKANVKISIQSITRNEDTVTMQLAKNLFKNLN
jgi:hypothetical protein